jgi:polysaccharide chain length determinant protein (PEP-CTERM system associated)
MGAALEQLRTILYAMWRKRWYGLAAAWAICLAGWLAVALIPNQYRSDARVFVRYNALLPSQLGLDKDKQSLAQIDVVRRTLTSRPNLEKVLRRTDLDLTGVEGAEMDALTRRLAENITVEPQGREFLYVLSYTAKDASLSDERRAQFAQRVVQNLIDIFVEDNVASDRDNLNQAIRFLDEQIAQRERQLEEAEARRAAFEQRYFDRLPGEGDVRTRLNEARREISRVEQEYVQARSSLGALQAQLASTPQTIDAPLFNVPGNRDGANFGTGTRFDPTTARGRIEVLERQISDAIARGYTDRHPDVVLAREQIERLRPLAAAEPLPAGGVAGRPAAQANPVYVNLRSLLFEKQSQVAALEARLAQLRSALSDLTAKQTEQPEIVAEQTRLNRDYSVLKAAYDNLLSSREQIRLRADVASQTDEVQFRTVDPPTLPSAPVAPNRSLLNTLVLLAGLGTGLAVAFLASALHPTYITEDRLAEDTGLPVLGSVAEVESAEAKAENRKWVRVFAALGLGLGGIYALLLVLQLAGRGAAVA